MRALLDTCVLFPRILRDVLLDAASAGLYDPLWSADILTELGRNLVEDRGLSALDANALTSAMETYFPDASLTNYQELIPRLTNHPKDRHVLAAAIAGRAAILVTSDVKDFPSSSLEQYELSILTPDAFLSQLFESARDPVIQVIVGLAARYRHPPTSVGELLNRLEKHAPAFTKRCTNHLVEQIL